MPKTNKLYYILISQKSIFKGKCLQMQVMVTI
jgi:hypothetical protein